MNSNDGVAEQDGAESTPQIPQSRPALRNAESRIEFSMDDFLSSSAEIETLNPALGASLEVIHQLPVALAVLDLETRYLNASRPFAHALGRKVHDLIGRRHADLNCGLPTGWDEICETTLRTGTCAKGEEAHFIKPDGNPEWIRWEVHPWRTKEGDVAGIFLVLEVVTRRMQFEALARRSMKNETIAQLCGRLGTNIKNLMTILEGYAMGVISADAADRAEAPHIAADAGLHQGIHRGFRLSESLTSLGRNRALEPRLTDLRDLLGEAVASIRASAPKNVRIAFLPREGIWHCFVDQTQLMNTLYALAENSIEAMSDGGDLTIALVRNDERQLTFSITDTGVGMSEATLKQAIEPFFSTKTGGWSNGLGLSLAYGFITHSNGELKIVSAPHAGTRVSISLPFHDWSWQG